MRPNNEDRFVADAEGRVFLVADGIGGQDCGEQASGMAADSSPRVLNDRLAARDDASHAVQYALAEANQAIISAGAAQIAGRRMGTTAVLAVCQDDHFYVASVGDSRAYWVRAKSVELLTVDHTIAEALARSGTLTADQAKQSPWRNVLYRCLGCVEMTEGADVRPLAPSAGDRLVMGSDGLTNFLSDPTCVTAPPTSAIRKNGPTIWSNPLCNVGRRPT